MFATAGTLVVISGFCGFLVFRLPMVIVTAVMTAGLLLVGVQLVNSIRIYRRKAKLRRNHVGKVTLALIGVPPKVGPTLKWR